MKYLLLPYLLKSAVSRHGIVSKLPLPIWPIEIVVMLSAALALCGACSPDVHIDVRLDKNSPLAAAYDSVAVPVNIAPLNFMLPATTDTESALILSGGGQSLTVVHDGQGAFIPDMKGWKNLLAAACGKEITVDHCVKTETGKWAAYRPFRLFVAKDSIDPYIVYRLIPPGYEKWYEMGIYQRCLENFDEDPVIENSQTDHNCMNCHSLCNRNPDKFLLHLRAKHAGTLLADNGTVVKLDTKTDRTISSLVYPYWHPGGRFIAFSVNDTHQQFHQNHRNRIEVFDRASDVVVYDVMKNQLLTTPDLMRSDYMETFPTFSADGTKLYFCTASNKQMPDEIEQLRYNLCAISFDAAHGTFGERVDTVFRAEALGKSVSFPRVSPDGRYLLMTLSDYGTFSIWHQEADLWLLDLKTGTARAMDEWNSPSVESYHCWSSNGRWVIFSSRRGDALYTRPYIAYMGADGRACKPFILPQAEGDFYHRLMFSYNIPEFSKGPVSADNRELVKQARNDEARKVR